LTDELKDWFEKQGRKPMSSQRNFEEDNEEEEGGDENDN
jgi:hypothetical protein